MELLNSSRMLLAKHGAEAKRTDWGSILTRLKNKNEELIEKT